MSRRRRDRSDEKIEATVKLVLALLFLLALGMGGIRHFIPAFFGLLRLLVIIAIAGSAIVLVTVLLVRHYRAGSTVAFMGPATNPVRPSPANVTPPAPDWTVATIRAVLDEIDWYQFEKFCAALLVADGFAVERRGGAHPDGGVDLIVNKSGARALIQCKHWRTWQVQEKTVREMLGSMTDFGVQQGAIYTLKGWTQPAADFAARHSITLVNGDELARSAKFQLTESQLGEFLRPGEHHCPKCEAPMVWRTGNFEAFWGCSRFPACRCTLKHSGAR